MDVAGQDRVHGRRRTGVPAVEPPVVHGRRRAYGKYFDEVERPAPRGIHADPPPLPDHPPTGSIPLTYSKGGVVQKVHGRRVKAGPLDAVTAAAGSGGAHKADNSFSQRERRPNDIYGFLSGPSTANVPVIYPPLPSGMDSPINTGPLAEQEPVNLDNAPSLKAIYRPNLHAHRARNTGRTLAAAVTTGGLLLTGAGAIAVTEQRSLNLVTASEAVASDVPRVPAEADDWIGPEIIAPSDPVTFARVDVGTVAAPPPPPPPPPPVPVARAPIATAAVPAPVPRVVASVPVPAPVVVAPAASKAAIIYDAARAQLGVYQDCVMLVTNSLVSVGIHFKDWPVGFLRLGTVIPASQAVPGDLMYYADGGAGVAHIAVYGGGGMGVHGGYNGNETRWFTAYVGSGPVFIRVR